MIFLSVVPFWILQATMTILFGKISCTYGFMEYHCKGCSTKSRCVQTFLGGSLFPKQSHRQVSLPFMWVFQCEILKNKFRHVLKYLTILYLPSKKIITQRIIMNMIDRDSMPIFVAFHSYLFHPLSITLWPFCKMAISIKP